MCAAIYLNPTFDEYSKAHAKEFSQNRGGGAAQPTQAATSNQAHSHTHAQSSYTYGDATSGGGATDDNLFVSKPSSTPFANQGENFDEDSDNPFAAV